jgi:hypothetical protein
MPLGSGLLWQRLSHYYPHVLRGNRRTGVYHCRKAPNLELKVNIVFLLLSSRKPTLIYTNIAY